MERKLFKCKRCGWEWLSAQETPTCCARCKNPYWDKEPKIKKAEANFSEGLTSAERRDIDEP
jgi:hypothetical protein